MVRFGLRPIRRPLEPLSKGCTVASRYSQAKAASFLTAEAHVVEPDSTAQPEPSLERAETAAC